MVVVLMDWAKYFEFLKDKFQQKYSSKKRKKKKTEVNSIQ